MKSIKYITIALSGLLLLASCEKRDYEKSLPEYDNHFYAAYIPNNNSAVTVQRNQAALLKFAVQFYSAFVRDFDAVAQYTADTTSYGAGAAKIGVDFDIVDKNGSHIEPVNGIYSFTFPQAKKAMDTIYVKLLNNTAAVGNRNIAVKILDHITDQYEVDIFSTAFNRPITIK